jgi:DNA uptake protein ComE-like DNA-binding protein
MQPQPGQQPVVASAPIGNTQAAGTFSNGGSGQIGQSNQTLGQSEVSTEEVQVQPSRRAVPTVTEVRTGADINRMTMADFEAIGLPKDQAQMVIQYRATHGPFTAPSELASVPTLDNQWLAKNVNRLAAGKENG